MKKQGMLLRSAILLGALAFSMSASQGGETRTFEGEISDSQCAMNVHSLHRSHEEMLSTGAAGATAADCTRYCVHERGGRYVLQTKKDVFKLSDQQLPEQYAGEKVKVTGTLDPQTKMIQVTAIVPLTK